MKNEIRFETPLSPSHLKNPGTMIPLDVSDVISAITAVRNTKSVLNLGKGVKDFPPN